MRHQVSGLVHLGKRPVRRLEARKPKFQVSWWKKYKRLDFWVNRIESENNRRPNTSGFTNKSIFTQTGFEAEMVEQVDEQPDLIPLEEIPPENEVEDGNFDGGSLELIAGFV